MDLTDIATWIINAINAAFSKELWSALVGAVIGGMFTLWATRAAQKSESKRASSEREFRQRQLEDDRVVVLTNTVALIMVEISTAWDLYQAEYALDLMALPDGDPYLCVFPVGSNPFPVFDSAPACLTQLPSETSKQIVRFYMRAKGLISMIEMNNADTERAREYANLELQSRPYQMPTVDMSEEQQVSALLAKYEEDARRMAFLIGMGTTADGLKGLTREIGTLVLDIESRLGFSTKSISNTMETSG